MQISSLNVIRSFDQFSRYAQKGKNINHLLMQKMIFRWGVSQQGVQTAIQNLSVCVSCPIHAVLSENPQGSMGPQEKVITGEGAVLQLREGYLVLYDAIKQQILDFCPCSLQLTFSLHEGPQTPQQSREDFRQKVQRFSVLRLACRNASEGSLAFMVRAEDKKSLEQFRTALEKCVILQKDFHRKFKPLRKLGKGATAAVYSALQLQNNSLVAVKAFNKSAHFSSSGGKGKEAFEKEVRALSQCNHHNLCSFKGVFETDNSLYVVMEAYDRSLSTLLRTQTALPRNLALALLEQLLQGVAHLHSRGLMHRDIKLENIMLKQTEAGLKAVLIDMGMAENYAKTTYLFEHCGTPGYAAPQVFGPRPANPEKCDVFSLGVVFHMLLFRKPVFAGSSCAEVCQNNRAGNMTLDTDQLGQEDQPVRDLLLRMLDLDNKTRISAGEALEHQLFNAPSVKTPFLTSADTDLDGGRSISLQDL